MILVFTSYNGTYTLTWNAKNNLLLSLLTHTHPIVFCWPQLFFFKVSHSFVFCYILLSNWNLEGGTCVLCPWFRSLWGLPGNVRWVVHSVGDFGFGLQLEDPLENGRISAHLVLFWPEISMDRRACELQSHGSKELDTWMTFLHSIGVFMDISLCTVII